jgi:ribosomal protein L37E
MKGKTMEDYEIFKRSMIAAAASESEAPSSFPATSNAIKTEMFTKCKRCGKANDNGYQYCTACHHKHKRTRKV